MRRAVSTLLFLLIALPCLGSIDLNSIVGIWVFDEEGNVVRDISGHGHDGKVPAGVKWVSGRIGKGVEFPGNTGDYISVKHDESLNLDRWTITAWIKLGKKDWQLIIQKNVNGTRNVNNYSLYTEPAGRINFNFFTEAGELNLLKGTRSVTDESWHHVAVTYDGSSMKLYIDGELDGETQTSAKPVHNTDPLVIGGDDRGASVQVKGVLDEIGLFNVPLSQDDIRTIMEKGLAQIAAVSPSNKLAVVWGRIKLLSRR